ncbi:MAG: dihydroorotate dehydrogenase catalytic subunit, partial [Thermoproteota archaeon]|nr:dihydroorotate dehydrogenase catalytic subunit [Thermoproteota archaeon]
SRKGYPNPIVVDVGCGFLNAVGLPNPGVKDFVEEIRSVKSKGEILVIASLYGGSAGEYAEAARIIGDSGVDAVELNLSCPNVKEVGMEVGKDPCLVGEIVRAVKQSVSIPVFTKLTSNISDIKEIAKTAEFAGSDALVAINTVRAMAIDVETGRPILSNKIGGLSGPAIKTISLRCVYEIAQVVDIPIIGCGGVTTWKDAIEFMLAGASAIQMGTAIAYKDVSVFKEVTDGISQYLERKGHKSLKEIVGLSQRF